MNDDGNPDLIAVIAAAIDDAGSAIPFARFMDLALYHPVHGYYRQRRPAPGTAGADFLTAPETHPIFGRVLGRQLREMQERLGAPGDFTVREYAAGGGALAEAVRNELAAGTRYQAIEVNEHRREELLTRLPDAEVAAHARAERFTGAVIANEFLDALPVHRVVLRDGGLREIHVRRQGARFFDEERDPSTPALAARLETEGIELREGQQAEINLGLDGWFHEVVRDLDRGYVVIVDYGYAAAELYSPRHGAGTLLGYAGHRVVDDPYRAVGHQDLTAHVDFTAVQASAEAVGLTPLGLTTQSEFLIGAGVEEIVERIRSDPATPFGEWIALRSALARMLDPRAMGAFRVLILGRGVAPEPPLRGLAYRLPTLAPDAGPEPASAAPEGAAR